MAVYYMTVKVVAYSDNHFAVAAYQQAHDAYLNYCNHSLKCVDVFNQVRFIKRLFTKVICT